MGAAGSASNWMGLFRSHGGRGAGGLLWGDGFVDDGMADLWAVRDWSAVSSDEYVLLFPRLSAGEGRLPPALLGHVAGRLAEHQRCLASVDHDGSAPRYTGHAARAEGGGTSADGAVAGQEEIVGVLLTAVEATDGRAAAWSEDAEAWFAFGAGVHSAYLWAEAALSPARAYTAAWLGQLDRGRSALMPAVVSEYLLDAVLAPSGRRDAVLAAQVDRVSRPADLRRAAERRAAGGRPVVAPRSASARERALMVAGARGGLN